MLSLDEIEALCAEASPGPWTYTTCYGVAFIEAKGKNVAEAVCYLTPNNADFIVTSRDLVPQLVARVRELEALHKRANELVDRYGGELLLANQEVALTSDQFKKALKAAHDGSQVVGEKTRWG